MPSGALEGDREFAIVDEAGKFVNGKRTARIHQLRSHFDLVRRRVTLRDSSASAGADAEPVTFELDGDRAHLCSWLSQFFGQSVRVVQSAAAGFPDDPVEAGPTIISTATLETAASWFDSLDANDMRQRFRANLELRETSAFWEDRLYAADGRGIPFQIGTVTLLGTNPCQRCIVPTRDARTGEAYPEFQRTFISQRKATLPAWVASQRFNHYYRLAVNTRLSDLGAEGVVRVGDRVAIAHSRAGSRSFLNP